VKFLHWNRHLFIGLGCKTSRSLIEESKMDEAKLPRDVLVRVEQRWAKLLSRQAAGRPARARATPEPAPDSAPSESKPAQPTSKRPDGKVLF
jgi:hypothetical protein